jgi:hypothetical protein
MARREAADLIRESLEEAALRFLDVDVWLGREAVGADLLDRIGSTRLREAPSLQDQGDGSREQQQTEDENEYQADLLRS